MAIDTIGSALSSTTTDLTKSTLNQQDFIKLFMTELTFQDPLEPINNREFLAQMAQFANLEQTRISNENTNNLVAMGSTAQSLGLLGRQVDINDQSGAVVSGAVSAISFTSTGPSISIKRSDGSQITDIHLSQILLVRS